MALISMLLPDLRGGGAERVQLDLAHEFVRAGHHVEFVLMRKAGEFLEEAERSFTVVDLESPRARGLTIPLARYLRSRRPDVLLVAMWPLTVITPIVARLAGFRGAVVVSEHNNLSAQYAGWGAVHRLSQRLSMAVGYRLAHARVAVSAGVADDISALSGLARNRFDVIHNPVPLRPAPAPEQIASSHREQLDVGWLLRKRVDSANGALPHWQTGLIRKAGKVG